VVKAWDYETEGQQPLSGVVAWEAAHHSAMYNSGGHRLQCNKT